LSLFRLRFLLPEERFPLLLFERLDLLFFTELFFLLLLRLRTVEERVDLVLPFDIFRELRVDELLILLLLKILLKLPKKLLLFRIRELSDRF